MAEQQGAEPAVEGQEESQDFDLTFTESVLGLQKLLKKREKDLDERSAELKRLKTSLEKEHPTFGAKPSDVLRLNVGGTKIDVLRSTLTCIEGSLLASQFSGRWDNGLAKDAEGNFFLDQRHDLFLVLVNYLRDKQNETHLAPPIISPSFGNEDDPDENTRIRFVRMLEHFNITLGVYPFSLYRIVGSGSNVQVMKSLYPGDVVRNETGTAQSYALDAALGSNHSFHVKSFEAVVEKGSKVHVGVCLRNALKLLLQAHKDGTGVGYKSESIAIDVARHGIAYDGNLTPLVHELGHNAHVRCEDFGKSWYVNGKLVASATSNQAGVVNIAGFFQQPRWSQYNLLPAVTIQSGSLRFTAIELEWNAML